MNLQMKTNMKIISAIGNIELEPGSSGFVTYSIYPKTGEKSNLLNIKILTSDLPSGLYLISLRNGMNMINKKLIVQHR